MLFLLRTSTILVLLNLAVKLIAQSPTTLHASSTISQAPQTHTVSVAKGSFAYEPDSIQARPGDLVVFQFFPSNHSVIRAAYGYPCVPYEDVSGPGAVGFYSGHFIMESIPVDPPTWNLTVNDTEPIFFYCSAPTSCINHQMVGVINPNSTQLLAEQKVLASSSDYMLEPGQPFPQEQASSMSVVAATATLSSEAGAASTGGTVVTVPPDQPSKSGLSSGAIAGIVIGGLAVLLLAALLFFYIGRNATLRQTLAFTQHPEAARSSLPPPPPAKDMAYSRPDSNSAAAAMDPYKSEHRQIPSYSAPPYSVAASNTPETAEELDSVASSPPLFGLGPRYTPGTEFGSFVSEPRSSQRNSERTLQRNSHLGPHEMDAS